jgi:hypothetical protein
MEFDTRAHPTIIISYHMNVIFNKKSNLSQTHGKLIENPHQDVFYVMIFVKLFKMNWYGSIVFYSIKMPNFMKILNHLNDFWNTFSLFSTLWYILQQI